MKNFFKRLICFLITLTAIVSTVFPAGNAAAKEMQEIDDFLKQIGTPQEVIDCLSENQKIFMAEKLDANAEFCSYNMESFNVRNDGIQPFSEISAADLSVVVSAYKCFVDGESAYCIFPTFIWNKLVKIKNDSFAFSLYQNWEIIGTADYNLRVHIKNANGDKVQHTDVAADLVTYCGQSYRMTDTGFMQGLYEGNAVFYAKKTSSTATPMIAYRYVHDPASLFSTSYSITIGPANISVSNESNLEVRTGYLSLE